MDMQKGPRFLSLAIIGALFFGLLIYVLLRITQIQETQEATQTRVEVSTNTPEEIAETTDAEMELSVDLLDDPIETEKWKKAEFDLAPLSFEYPADWDLNTVAPLEWYVETADGTSIKVRIADYETAPSEPTDNAPLTLSQTELDARREAIDADENGTRINGFTALVNVQRDTSSLSVVAITEFFLDNDYVVISLPFDVSHLYDSEESETLIDAFITELKEGLPREAASVADIRAYQYYRELVQSINRTDVEEAEAVEEVEADDETAKVDEDADDDLVVVDSADGLYTDTVNGFTLSIPEGWGAPGTEYTAVDDEDKIVQASITPRADRVATEEENGQPLLGPTVAEHDAIVSDLKGTATTTKWLLSSEIVVPITTLTNGARAYFYYGGTEGGAFVKEYVVLTPDNELLRLVVNPELLFYALYPGGRPNDLVTPQGELAEDAKQELQDLFAEFDEIVNTLEWTK